MSIPELIRSLIWGITSLFLNIIDSLWNIARMIVGMDFANQEWIWSWLKVLNVFLIFFVIVFSFKTFIKAYFDDDYMNNINISKLLMKLFMVFFFIAIMPLGIQTVSSMSSQMAKNIGTFTGVGESKLSTIIVNSSSMDLSNIDEEFAAMGDVLSDQLDSANDNILSESSWEEMKSRIIDGSASYLYSQMPESERVSVADEIYKTTYDEYVEWKESINYDSILGDSYWVNEDINDIDINSGETSGEWYDYLIDSISFGFSGDLEKAYYFFPSWSSLFLVLITSLVFLLIFIGVIIQMAQRIFSLVLKVFLMPYAVSTMVDPESKTFSVWIKYMVADVLSNWFQLYSVMFLFAFIGNNTLENLLVGSGPVTIEVEMTKLLLLIGGLMAIYTSPSGIAAILGGSEVSASSSLMNTTSMLRMAYSGIGAVGTVGALGYVGLTSGGNMGLRGINNATRATSAVANMVTGGSYGNSFGSSNGIGGRIKSTGLGSAIYSGLYGGSSGDAGSGSGIMTAREFNDSPTQSQMEKASNLDIKTEGMNKGQLGIKIDRTTDNLRGASNHLRNNEKWNVNSMTTNYPRARKTANTIAKVHSKVNTISKNKVTRSSLPINFTDRR